jgi:solute carrier family 25 carnitine/acylcarnitine transporter 20/29
MDFVYGCVGGVLGTIISHPIDTIKSRIQLGLTFKQAFQRYKFYNGIASPLFGIPLEKSIVFGCCELTKSCNIGSFLSGFIAGFVSTLIVTPIEYIKINAQNGNTVHIGLKNIMNLYRGLGPTICRESPGYGVYFATYDTLDKNFNLEKSSLKSFLFGGITGLSSWLVIYPTDLVKTIMQNKNNTQSAQHIIKIIFKNEGIMGFYKGLNFALMRAIPLHAGVFGGYELCKKLV